ncbi:MAG: lysophospholipid acyltransferase family protein, partial [Melioribacteraceae bacterium]|nr:lysophospholipid acyltransferase family protein [Melioribacteraceae bacterium]
KPQSNKYISKWIDDVRMQFGNKVIPLGASIRNIYKALKEGNAVGIVGDQRGSREGMRVKFFNQSTAVYPGAAQIAIKNRVPIVTVIAARVSDNKFNTFIGEIRTDDLTGSIEDQVKEVNQRYMSVLEDIIRKYPDQWFWMHNIWKY